MSSKNVLKLMKDKQVEFVDLRFTDPHGKIIGLKAKGKAKHDDSGFVVKVKSE